MYRFAKKSKWSFDKSDYVMHSQCQCMNMKLGNCGGVRSGVVWFRQDYGRMTVHISYWGDLKTAKKGI